MKSELENFDHSQIAVEILDERIFDEIDKFQNGNDSEEKAQELSNTHTPEGGFDSVDHNFVVKLFKVFGYELSGNQSAMNRVCVLLSNFFQNIQQQYNHLISEEGGILNG